MSADQGAHRRGLAQRAIVSALLLGAAVPAAAATGFLTGEQISGQNKICFYNVLGSAYAVTVRSFDVCALRVDTEQHQQPDRRSPGVDWDVPDLGQRAANQPTLQDEIHRQTIQRAEIREAQNREREARMREAELDARVRELESRKSNGTSAEVKKP
jgi:hypothetical protein